MAWWISNTRWRGVKEIESKTSRHPNRNGCVVFLSRRTGFFSFKEKKKDFYMTHSCRRLTPTPAALLTILLQHSRLLTGGRPHTTWLSPKKKKKKKGPLFFFLSIHLAFIYLRTGLKLVWPAFIHSDMEERNLDRLAGLSDCSFVAIIRKKRVEKCWKNF